MPSMSASAATACTSASPALSGGIRVGFNVVRPAHAQGVLRRVETVVTQRETWRRTPQGWKLSFVDEVRDHVRRAEDEN